jgi:hypothetical protein
VGIFCVTAKAVTYKDRVPAKVKRAGPAKSIGDAGSAQGALCSSGQAGATRDKAKAALFGVEFDGAWAMVVDWGAD